MYTNALELLEEEREAWAPYEALDQLSDEELERPTDPHGPAHGWTGRDLMGHMLAWQEHALNVAKELAVNETSPSRDRMRADWDARGDAVNEELLARWRDVSLDDLRRRFRELPGELRGYLTVVPETRWIKNADNERFFLANTIEHYEEHRPELEGVLAAVRAPA